jgi:hypothetical protein
MSFTTNASEAMRIDSSGNVIVGHTSADDTTASASLRYDGRIYSTVSGDQCLSLNRLASDGEIITFKKDSSTVGSIGTNNDDLLIYSTATGHKGLRFAGGEILPVSNAGALEDNTTDLGSSTYRFKDLYLSGNAVVSKVAGVGDTDTAIDFISPNIIAMNTGGTEAMRIDSSGNVLVGKTGLDVTDVGHELRSSGYSASTRDGSTVGSYTRLNSDGTILEFRKDSAAVGSVTADNGYLGIGKGDTGLLFQEAQLVWSIETLLLTWVFQGDDSKTFTFQVLRTLLLIERMVIQILT